MAEIKTPKIGTFGLIQITDRGITQIALTEEQSELFQFLVATLGTKEKPLTRLPKGYDLIINESNK